MMLLNFLQKVAKVANAKFPRKADFNNDWSKIASPVLRLALAA